MRQFTKHTLGLLLPLWLLTFTVQGQITRYVSTTGINTTPASATSWATSTTNLQGAIDASNANDQVWVAAGSYKPTSNTADRGASFSMKNGIAIYGGFVGTEQNLSLRPTINPVNGVPSSSTLSGEIGDPASTTDNSYHVMYNPASLSLNNTAVLDGFVITGGNANEPGINSNGGGVYNDGYGSGKVCSPSFRNCVLQGNAALQNGGAMLNYGENHGSSSPVLTNCLMQGNTAFNGGAMFNDAFSSGSSSPVLINCSMQGNTAYNGGALNNNGYVSGISSPVLTNCSLQGNVASNHGGAIFSEGSFSGSSSPVLTNCVLWNNGGDNTFYNSNATGPTATYSLFDNTNGVSITGPGNLTTSVSPFVSTNSVALAACSPAINSGDNSATGLMGITTDLAGNPRIVDGRVDMGAVEYQPPLQPPPSQILSFRVDESGCPVRLLGQGVGTAFIFTGPGDASSQGYVFCNVFRMGGTHDLQGLEVRQPGTYTLTATYTTECGSSQPVSQTVTVGRSCP